VYIHCAAGVGRAPLVAAAYLVSQGMSVDQARTFLRERRPFINQSESQKQRLIQFAEAIGADVR
ncbi:MAG: dual specificity protein phosphatase family protein, partial [Anaerolineae bacterium]|nr:dual specificity protein phosphatase family protein [Anaerolineae bacterium]